MKKRLLALLDRLFPPPAPADVAALRKENDTLRSRVRWLRGSLAAHQRMCRHPGDARFILRQLDKEIGWTLTADEELRDDPRQRIHKQEAAAR